MITLLDTHVVQMIHHLRDMQEHILITLTPRCDFHIARTSAFDLHSAASLLLDVFDVLASLTNNLRTEVETRKRL